MRYSAVQPSESIRVADVPDRVPCDVLVAVVEDRVVGLHPGGVHRELVAGPPVVVGVEHQRDVVGRRRVVAAGEQAHDAVGVGIECPDEGVQVVLVVGDASLGAELRLGALGRLGLEELSRWPGRTATRRRRPDRRAQAPRPCAWPGPSSRSAAGSGAWPPRTASGPAAGCGQVRSRERSLRSSRLGHEDRGKGWIRARIRQLTDASAGETLIEGPLITTSAGASRGPRANRRTET